MGLESKSFCQCGDSNSRRPYPSHDLYVIRMLLGNVPDARNLVGSAISATQVANGWNGTMIMSNGEMTI
jgi:hypothetical protein